MKEYAAYNGNNDESAVIKVRYKKNPVNIMFDSIERLRYDHDTECIYVLG